MGRGDGGEQRDRATGCGNGAGSQAAHRGSNYAPPYPREKEHKGGELPRAIAADAPFYGIERAPEEPQTIFVLPYIPLKSSLCSFELKHASLSTRYSYARYLGGAMVVRRVSRLEPCRDGTALGPDRGAKVNERLLERMFFIIIRVVTAFPEFSVWHRWVTNPMK